MMNELVSFVVMHNFLPGYGECTKNWYRKIMRPILHLLSPEIQREITNIAKGSKFN